MYPRSKAKQYAKSYDKGVSEFYDPIVRSIPGMLSGTIMAFLGDPLNPGTLSAGSEINPTGGGSGGVGGVRPSKKSIIKKIGQPLLKAGKKIVSEAIDDPIIVQHNINPGALERAERMGGLPMPSMAITKVSDPNTGYGPISLLGGPELAKPSAKNPVYASDAYTIRQPKYDVVPDDESVQIAKKLFNVDDKYTASDLVESIFTGENTYGNPLLTSAYLKSKGIKISGPKSKKYEDVQEYERNLRNKFYDLQDSVGYEDYGKWIENQKNKIQKKGGGYSETFFKGFTNIGNRRDAPATLENVLKEMRSKQGGGKAGDLVGVDLKGSMGNLRSLVTPKFKTLDQVKKSRDRIVSSENFNIEKTRVQEDFLNLNKNVSEFLENTPGYQNSSMNTVDEIVQDLVSGKSSRDWFPHEIPQPLKDQATKVRGNLKDMSTEYFEIKPKRGVELSEFEGAIIPKDTSKNIKDILKNSGIRKILQYGSEDERKALFAKFPELMFMFPVMGGGLLNLNSDE